MPKHFKFSFLASIFCGLLLAAEVSQSATFRKVELPDEIKVGGKVLVLNGIGLREVTHMMMDFDVYVAGLYVEKKTTEAKDIISSKGLRVVKMHLLMGLSKKNLTEGWDESFERICKKNVDPQDKAMCDGVTGEFEKFKSALIPAKKSQVFDYVFSGNRVTIELEGKAVFESQSPLLSEFFLSAWVGPKPISAILKDRLLGIKL